MRKILNISLAVATSLLLSACTSSAPTLPDSADFKKGNHDGCATAKGEYTKNSEMFRGSADYQDGWYYGRKHCNPAQKVQ
ncbi:MAG: hypothetical protein WBM70_10945 [Sulfurovum sp.]|uniref:hypothetical protein n=1 Tax=Sulfurovum sp. TaxID=1969726 RepID=UPI003C778A11